jgi:hypothetical protein
MLLITLQGCGTLTKKCMRGEPSPSISLLPCRMEPEVNELIMDSLNINYIDESEYPSTTDIQNRCGC